MPPPGAVSTRTRLATREAVLRALRAGAETTAELAAQFGLAGHRGPDYNAMLAVLSRLHRSGLLDVEPIHPGAPRSGYRYRINDRTPASGQKMRAA